MSHAARPRTMTYGPATSPTAAASSRRVVPTAASVLGLEPSAAVDLATTDALVRAGAYFSLFSLPNPASPNQPIPLIPALADVPLWYGFKVNEDLHRFEVHERPPSAACGLRIRQDRSRTGVAKVKMEMIPMPNYFEPAPDRTPAPTVLLPFLAQRFAPYNGSIEFTDAEGSGFTATGAGHTYPASGGQQPRLIAVLDIDQGHGKLAGHQGTGIVSGGISPPLDFAFSVLFRVVNPSGSLEAKVPPGPIAEPSDPTPQTSTEQGTSFLQFLAEEDPAHPITVERQGQVATVTLVERLRLVDLSFNVDPPGLRSRTQAGPIVGRHRTTLRLNLGQSTSEVIAAFSEGDEFTFFDGRRNLIGGFKADTTEARLFPTAEAGGAMMRIGGYALPTEGTGPFRNPVGQVSINGAFSPVTGAISTLYLVRLSVPDAVFKVVA